MGHVKYLSKSQIFQDFPHKFVKTLPETLNLTEKDMLVLKVTTHEDFATVRWFKDGEEVKNVRKRNQRMKTLSTECQHILAIEKCLTSDAGTYRAETNTQVTTANISVAGEPHIEESAQLCYVWLYL